jgi:hypothetical protein
MPGVTTSIRLRVQGYAQGCGHTRGLCRYHQLALAVLVAACLDVIVTLMFSLHVKAMNENRASNAVRNRIALYSLSLACELIILVATVLTLHFSKSPDAWFLALSFSATVASFCANLIGTRKLLFHVKVAAEVMVARISGRAHQRRLTDSACGSAKRCSLCSHAPAMQAGRCNMFVALAMLASALQAPSCSPMTLQVSMAQAGGQAPPHGVLQDIILHKDKTRVRSSNSGVVTCLVATIQSPQNVASMAPAELS